VFLGASFYVNSYKALRNKSANMDVLVMLGTTSAWTYAMVLIIVGYSYEDREDETRYMMAVEAHAHMFEISSVLITIILLGKFLESISKKKTVDKLS
jgi:P-type Cu+ transporter